jgi:hypothetical protein
MSINILTVTFDLPLTITDLYQFRGAVIGLAGLNLPLFHNREVLPQHKWGKTIERYPLIQYREVGGKAALWAMNEGIDDVMELLLETDFLANFSLNGQSRPLQIERMKQQKEVVIAMDAQWHEYKIEHAALLNEQKYELFKSTDSVEEQAQLLEKIIVNELVLLGYATQTKFAPHERVQVRIERLPKMRLGYYNTKDQYKQAVQKAFSIFEIYMQTPLLLPEGLSIGRHKSVGYGVIRGERNKE